ncbi:hypothetical protein LEMLEM_LOCUS893 [Lemmus lemmus]
MCLQLSSMQQVVRENDARFETQVPLHEDELLQLVPPGRCGDRDAAGCNFLGTYVGVSNGLDSFSFVDLLLPFRL